MIKQCNDIRIYHMRECAFNAYLGVLLMLILKDIKIAKPNLLNYFECLYGLS